MNDMKNFDKFLNDKDFLAYIEQIIPEGKKQKIADVLPYRTRHITVVTENVLNSNNANAILRTAEALGIQEAHIVYGNIKYIPQKSVSKGAHLWMDLHHYDKASENNAQTCIDFLKQRGYQIVITSPNGKNDIHEINLQQPVALCLGQESKGLSNTFTNNADIQIAIPQFGFTESYNVAVAAGMLLLPLIEKLHSTNVNWEMSKEEKEILYKKWILSYPKSVDEHYKRYYEKRFSL